MKYKQKPQPNTTDPDLLDKVFLELLIKNSI